MIIALYALAGCVGLLIGLALWFAIRVHVAEDEVEAQTRAIGRLHHLMVAHERYMRLAVKDASHLGADFMRRLDEHEERLDHHKDVVAAMAHSVAKLDRAGHRHPEQSR